MDWSSVIFDAVRDLSINIGAYQEFIVDFHI
jgi:hypothetical protein